MSTCGALRSRNTCGAFGISSERSFVYSFSMEKTGWSAFCGSLMEIPSGERGAPGGAGNAKRSGGREQRVEPTRAVERGEVVVAAHVAVAHVDLGHGAPSGALHHFVAAAGLEVDADLLDLGDALRFQKALGHHAVGTDTGGVHQDLRHVRVTSPRAGSPCAIRRGRLSVGRPW